MLCEVPLTKEQQAFATAHHSLVYKFLNENRLPEDEFYDVVIFGYLKAVGITFLISPHNSSLFPPSLIGE